jgi:pimeloyl-ACP methyl ester carboxylesterase
MATVNETMITALAALTLTEPSQGLLERNGRQVRWFSLGNGPATVVLEPGAGDPSTTWFPVVLRLATVARVVMYDRAGFGGSDEAGRLSLELTLGDLKAVVADVARSDLCVLVGHSWGGLLVQMLALAEPGLVSALVLVDPAHEQLWLDLPPGELDSIERAGRILDIGGRRAEHAETARWLAESATDDVAVRELLLRAHTGYAATEIQVRNAAAELPLIVASLDEIVRRRAAAPPIAAPTVVLTAMKGRPEKYRQPVLDVQEGLVAAMPRAIHKVIWDSGHYIHVEQPEHVVSAIKDVTILATSGSS